MTPGQIVQSAIEFILVCVVIVGLFNESKIADWEQKMFKKIKKAVKNLEAN